MTDSPRITTYTSREFNQDASGAKRAAEDGPVYITDRGRPAHVLLTMDEYQRLSAPAASIVDLLGLRQDDDIAFGPARADIGMRPADLG